MEQDDKSDNNSSVMTSFMSDMATLHAEKPNKTAILGNENGPSPSTNSIDGETDLLNTVFGDNTSQSSVAQNTQTLTPNDEQLPQDESTKASSETTRRDSPPQEFAKATLFSTSKIPLLAYGALAMVLGACSQFPTMFANLLFSPDELKELPGFILNNIPTVFGGFFFILSAGAIYIGLKESFTGKLNVFEDYLAFKSNLFKTHKMHYADVRSIVIHRSPYSLFGDVGHLEVMGKSKEFVFKNVSRPFELKEILLERKNKYLNNV